MQVMMLFSLNVKLSNPLELQVISSHLNASNVLWGRAIPTLECLNTLGSYGFIRMTICAGHAMSTGVPLRGTAKHGMMMMMIEIIQQIIRVSYKLVHE